MRGIRPPCLEWIAKLGFRHGELRPGLRSVAFVPTPPSPQPTPARPRAQPDRLGPATGRGVPSDVLVGCVRRIGRASLRRVNRFDVLLVAVTLIFLLIGAWRGLVRIALGAAGLIVGVILAIRLEARATPVARRVVDSELFAPLLAFVAVVLLVVIVFFLAAWLIRSMLRVAKLTWIDRLMGAAAGFACAILLAAGLCVLVASSAPETSRFLSDSALAPYTLQLSRGIARLAPPDLRNRFQAGWERIQRSWDEARTAAERGQRALAEIP